MFESLLNDKVGRELAYKRMHQIHSLIKDIKNYAKNKYEK